MHVYMCEQVYVRVHAGMCVCVCGYAIDVATMLNVEVTPLHVRTSLTTANHKRVNRRE